MDRIKDDCRSGGTSNPARESAGVCLIPTCRYTQAGLERLGQELALAVHIIDREADVMLVPPVPFHQVVCHLGGGIAERVSRVALLGHYLLTYGDASPVVILIQEEVPWLYGTLLHLAGRAESLRRVWTLDARCPVSGLVDLMQGRRPEATTPLKGRECDTRACGLTRREIAVVMAVLAGERIRDMARRTGLSVSVLHAQRFQGLRKLGLRVGANGKKEE